MARVASGRGSKGVRRLRGKARGNGKGVAEMSDELQRALGRVEGKLDAMLEKQDGLVTSLGDHKNEDQKNFSSLRKLVYDLRDELKSEIATIQQDANKAKGAGWVILGLLGAVATFIGGAVIAALNGHIKFG